MTDELPNPLAGRVRPLPIGPLLVDGLRLYARNAAALTFVSLVMYAPLLVIAVMGADEPVPVSPEAVDPLSLSLTMLVALTLQHIATAALVPGVVLALRGGGGVDIGACFGAAMGRILPILGVSVLSSTAIVVGMMLLVVPGLVAATVLAVAVPLVVIDGLSPLHAMQESERRTNGHRLRLLALLLVCGVSDLGLRYFFEAVVFQPGSAEALWAGLVLTVVVGAVEGAVDALVYLHLVPPKSGPTPAEPGAR